MAARRGESGIERRLLAGLESADAARRRVRGWRAEAASARMRVAGRPKPSEAARRRAAQEAALAARKSAIEARRRRAPAYDGDPGPAQQALGRRAVEIDGVTVAARRSPLRDRRGRWTDEQIDIEERFARLAERAARLDAIRGCLAERTRGNRSGDPDARRARLVADWRRFQRVAAAVPRAPTLKTPDGRYSAWEVLRLVSLEGLPLSVFGTGRRYQQARALLVEALERVGEAFKRVDRERRRRADRRESGQIAA